ncbi:centromere protein Q [Pelodytes ibericus]
MSQRKKTPRKNPDAGSFKKPSKSMRQSPGEKKQKSLKKRHVASENKPTRRSRVTFQKPLTAGVAEHIESCMESAILSVLSKKLPVRQSIQEELTAFKHRLLRHCKNAKFPSTKLGSLKNLRRNMLEEQQIMDDIEENLTSLEGEIERSVENAHTTKESIDLLEDKIQKLKQEELGSDNLEMKMSNSDALQIPKASYQAPTLQENAQKLKNPTSLLKELNVMQSHPAAIDMFRLIEKSHAEIDAL